MRDNDQLDMTASDRIMDSITQCRIRYFVHYTVENPPGVKKHMVAGPYTEDEVLKQRLDISTYSGVIDAYVSESNQRVKD